MSEPCPLNNLENIVLATDGSSYSEGAVKEAIVLAKLCSSRLTAMVAVEANEEFASEAPRLVEKQAMAARKHLESVKARAVEAGVECDISVHEGPFAHSLIIDVAKKSGAELIVMGRRGRTGLMKVAMGSVTARVIGHAPCDVLVVPRECTLEFKTIMAATDGSHFGEAAVAEAIKMAEKCNSSLLAISVASSDTKAEEAAEALGRAGEMAADAGISLKTITATGKPYVEIVKAAGREAADLIVVSCHGRGGLSRLLMGSVTERVIGNSPCAVMVACAP